MIFEMNLELNSTRLEFLYVRMYWIPKNYIFDIKQRRRKNTVKICFINNVEDNALRHKPLLHFVGVFDMGNLSSSSLELS